MPRRKQLKGLAQSISQWSLSRNFDYEGYWAIGRLYLLCKERGISEVTVPVIELGKKVDSKDLSPLSENIFEFADKYLEANSMPANWINQLNATYKFEQEYQGKYHYYGSAIGKPFICLVEVATDLGRVFYGETGANCRVHDPRRESRRSGF